MTGTYITTSARETEDIGFRFAETLSVGDVVAIYGELGAGKTVFARGILRGLGFTGTVSSPTFTIVNEYTLDGCTVAHFDMYRVEDEETLEDALYYDYLTKAIVIVEWGDRIENILNEDTKRIYITGSGDNSRSIDIIAGRTHDDICS